MPSLRCVLYHNISATESPFEAGLGVTTHPDKFEQHVEFYRKNYDIIDLDTLIRGKLPKRPLLITFDDCYRSVLDAVRDVLAPKGLPSVFFINPSLIGNATISLDQMIAWAANTHGLAAVARALSLGSEQTSVGALVASALSTCTAKQRAAVRARLTEAFPIDSDQSVRRSASLSADDLRELVALGVDIGNHTAGHVHCGALAADEYEAELVQAKRQLEQVSGSQVRSFSVAYGHERDLPPSVLEVLRESGHKAIFLVHSRSNAIRPHRDVWYRVSFRNESLGTVRRNLELLPVLRTAKSMLRL
jgi:peptidoglycan/xylan/chitin deacetylase (PgdA/CDA1 family)